MLQCYSGQVSRCVVAYMGIKHLHNYTQGERERERERESIFLLYYLHNVPASAIRNF